MTTMQSPPIPPEPHLTAATLDYANPRTRVEAPPGNKLLVLAVSVAVALLGANAFADAAGFPVVRNANYDAGAVMLRILSGIVVFLLSLAVVSALLRAVRAGLGLLARTPERPAQVVGLTMIACGTACVVATLVTELLALRWATRTSMSVYMGEGVEFNSGAPLSIHLAALAAFAAGAALVGIGVWSSLGSRGPSR